MENLRIEDFPVQSLVGAPNIEALDVAILPWGRCRWRGAGPIQQLKSYRHRAAEVVFCVHGVLAEEQVHRPFPVPPPRQISPR